MSILANISLERLCPKNWFGSSKMPGLDYVVVSNFRGSLLENVVFENTKNRIVLSIKKSCVLLAPKMSIHFCGQDRKVQVYSGK